MISLVTNCLHSRFHMVGCIWLLNLLIILTLYFIHVQYCIALKLYGLEKWRKQWIDECPQLMTRVTMFIARLQKRSIVLPWDFCVCSITGNFISYRLLNQVHAGLLRITFVYGVSMCVYVFCVRVRVCLCVSAQAYCKTWNSGILSWNSRCGFCFWERFYYNNNVF